MRQGLHILAKDIRRLRYHLLGAFTLWAVYAYLANHAAQYEGFTLRSRPIRMLYSQVLTFLPLTWAYLIASAVHEEAMPGDRQFWLTRPYSRGSLLGGKALFVGLFICLPALVIAVVTLLRAGFSPALYVGDLAWSQVLLLCMGVLPFFAVASVTRSLSQFILTAIGCFVAFMVFNQAVSSFSRPVSWGGFEWVRSAFYLSVFALAGTAVAALQFFRRRTAAARAVLAAGVVGAFLSMTFPWETAFAIQARTAARRIAHDEVRLSFDPSRGRFQLGPSRNLGGPRFWVPVRLEHAPAMAVEAQYVEVSIRSARGSWAASAIGHSSPAGLRWVREEGQYRLEFALDGPQYGANGQLPVDLHVTAYFNLFGRGDTQRARLTGSDAPIPGLGICRASDEVLNRGAITRVGCRMAFHPPQRAMMRLEHPSGAATEEMRLGGGPIGGIRHMSVMHPVEFQQAEFFRLSESGRVFEPGMLRDADLVVDLWRLEGHLKKELDIRGVKLEDWDVQPQPKP
ncbi:MAG: ABC transporter permease subunit [Bryobacteraceae bacterium]